MSLAGSVANIFQELARRLLLLFDYRESVSGGIGTQDTSDQSFRLGQTDHIFLTSS